MSQALHTTYGRFIDAVLAAVCCRTGGKPAEPDRKRGSRWAEQVRIAAARAALGCIDPHRSPRLPRTSLLASPRDIRPVPEGAARHEHSARRILEGDARLTPCGGALTRRAACRCGSGRHGCRRCRACRGCASRRCRLRRTTTPTSTWTSSAPSPTCGPGTTPSRKSMLSRFSAQRPFPPRRARRLGASARIWISRSSQTSRRAHGGRCGPSMTARAEQAVTRLGSVVHYPRTAS